MIVIGSGIAGLVAALTAAPRARVALVTKGALDDGCSRWAQGGIAAAVGPHDSPDRHFDDTVAAGRGLSDPAAARVLVDDGPARIRELIEWGVAFDTQDGELLLAREAAHSEQRILHAGGDGTGLEIETALIRRLRRSGATVMEQSLVTGLLLDHGRRCVGVELFDVASGASQRVGGSATILASGGAGQLWRNTTNPQSATGDGIALAYQAGAEVASMEFVQFHPTALALDGAPRYLISEAVRGEGAHIVDDQGRRFVLDSDPRGELAGRDVVARAIWDELQRSEASSVYLDCTPIGERAAIRFPTIHRTCLDYGIDITRDRIPIAPAAHYLIGGVRTNLSGASSVAGLYACGEVAYSGVHGANRLASNSLLESAVFAHRAAVAALSDHAEAPRPQVSQAPGARPQAPGTRSPAPKRSDAMLDRLRDVMWEGAGVVRNGAGLRSALSACEDITAAAESDHSPAGFRVQAAATTASLICAAALVREESRGCHLRSDFPDAAEQWRGVVVMQKQKGAHVDRNT